MRERQVILAPEARVDLFGIYDHIAGAASPGVALGYVERIERFCERLSVGSERGHRRDDVRPGLRIVGFERRVTVAFAVEAERVVVLRLFYGGRDWERLIE